MAIYSGIQSLIGHTPLFKITRIPLPNDVNVYVKLEAFNPGGSVKDRLGQELIEEALKAGKISKRGTIIEPTAGNTGIGIALAAIGTELNVIFVVPEKFSHEKQLLMRALGAEIVTTPTEEGMTGAIEKTKSLLQQIPDSYSPAQFENEANPNAYYKTLAPELYDELNGDINIFIAGAGTGGTFTGTARYLKEQDPTIKTVIVEPEGSILNGGLPGSHRTEGIGLEFIPEYMNKKHFDAIHTISDDQAFSRVKELAEKEGLLVGSSSGAVFAAVIKEAEKAKSGSNIVTIFPDSSERYLSKHIYDGGI